MPWCPICKNEYRDGVTVCADCGSQLVDALSREDDFIPVFSAATMEYAEKLSAYLKYSKIDNIIKQISDDEISVLVDPDFIKKAKSACAAFAVVESNEINNKVSESDMNISDEEADESDESENTESRPEISKKILYSQDSTVYVKKSDQVKDLKSTAATFYLFGVLLLVFTILSVTKVITIFSGPISLGCLALMTVACFAVGLNSTRRAKKAIIDSAEEDKLTDSINQWLSDNITEEVVKSFDKEEYTAEVNYLERFDGIKSMLTEVYNGIDDAYLDSIIEEYYNNNFDN